MRGRRGRLRMLVGRQLGRVDLPQQAHGVLQVDRRFAILA